MTKSNSYCTCGNEMSIQITGGKQELFNYEEFYQGVRFIGEKLPYCTNKSCHKYLLLQASEIEVNEDEESSTKYFNSF